MRGEAAERDKREEMRGDEKAKRCGGVGVKRGDKVIEFLSLSFSAHPASSHGASQNRDLSCVKSIVSFSSDP